MALPLNYHWRNLFVRKTTTTLTVLVIATVVGTLTWIAGFAWAVHWSLNVATDPGKMIVLQRGTDSETNSNIVPEEMKRLSQLTGVEMDAAGEPLISTELYWQTQLPRIRDGGTTSANVALRGVTDKAFAVHRSVKLLGEKFSTGEPEIIVGVKAAKQFRGLQIGDKLKLGVGENRLFKVVGYFSAAGSPMESEIWMYLPAMQSAYQRNSYSSAALRLRADADAESLRAQIEGPAIQLGGLTESKYWEKQSGNTILYQYVCFALVAIMSLAAIFAIANTMYAAVDGRTREIAMLRTIGFRPWQISAGFTLESVMLSLLGGALGCAGCALYLFVKGNTKDMFGSTTFTTMAFEIDQTAMLFAVSFAMISVTVIGAVAALLPASRAAGLQVIAALREP